MRNRFTEEEIIDFLALAASGVSIRSICLEQGFSEVTFYSWRGKYSGMSIEAIKRFREIERENIKLRKQLDESLSDIEALKVVIDLELNVSKKRTAAYNIQTKLNLSERKVCQLLNISRSVFRYQSRDIVPYVE